MGTGLILPPPFLSLDGVNFVPVTRTQVQVGTGLFGRQDPTTKRLALDALTFDPPEVFSLFWPGAISAAVTLGQWTNSRSSGSSIGLAMDANYKTAPTTGDVANYFALRAADAFGGAMNLPLVGAAQQHFGLNQGRGVIIAQPFSLAATHNWGQSSNLNPGGFASSFVPTQQLTVTGVAPPPFMMQDAGGSFIQGNYAVRILDANWNELAVSKQFVTAIPAAGTNTQAQDFPFKTAITLAAGTTYIVAIDFFDNVGNDSTSQWQWFFDTIGVGNQQVNSASITPGTFYVAKMWNAYNSGPAVLPSGVTWNQIGPNGSPYHGQLVTAGTSAAHTNSLFDGSNSGFYGATALIGSGAGASFRGNVTLSIVTVGAPLATSGGSDLNARVLLGT